MGLRFGLISLLLAISVAAESSSSLSSSSSLLQADIAWAGTATCDGLIGDCMEPEEETLMSSEEARRSLAQARRFISYGALQRDRVPCSRRGSSYYNCGRSSRANPYRRGCSVITRCARYTN